MVREDGKDARRSDERQVIKPSATIFFLDKKLVKVITSNRGANIVYLYNMTDAKNQTMLRSDFRKNRKRAYLVIDAARLLKISEDSIYRYIKSGAIDPPTGSLPGGERRFRKKSYYSEDYIFVIREAMTKISPGRPRSDGIVSNSKVLTEEELRARMGDALILYTRTEDGRYIPVWQEHTY